MNIKHKLSLVLAAVALSASHLASAQTLLNASYDHPFQGLPANAVTSSLPS